MKNKNVRGILALAVVTALSFGVILGSKALAQDTEGESAEAKVTEELDTKGAEGIESASKTACTGVLSTFSYSTFSAYPLSSIIIYAVFLFIFAGNPSAGRILLLTESFPPITIFLNLDKKSKERL